MRVNQRRLTVKLKRIYRCLVNQGHTAQKAAEIVLDAQRGNRHARTWVGVVVSCRH